MNWNTVTHYVMHSLGLSKDLPQASTRDEAKEYYLNMAVSHKDRETRQYALGVLRRCFGVRSGEDTEC